MKQTKLSRRVEWIKENEETINAARQATNNHSQCKGKCCNGRTCKTQSGGGYGFWVHAFVKAGVKCEPMSYWSGSCPTPSTSINRGVAAIINTAPIDIR